MFDGTIRKRKDGRFELQITLGKDENGKKIRKSFYGKKEREVIKKRDEWLRETYNISKSPEQQKKIYQNTFHDGTFASMPVNENINLNCPIFSDWATEWLEVYKKHSVRPYTYQNTYKSRVDKYLIPYFGQRSLGSIKNSDIRMFFNDYKYLSLSLLKTLKVILNDIFKKAITNNFITINPVDDITPISIQKKTERAILTGEQQKIAIEWALRTECLDVLLVLKTGLRRSEMIGLRWCDIDLENRIITVNQALSPIVEGKIDKELKTQNSHRQIPYDVVLAKELNERHKLIGSENELVLNYQNANSYSKYIERKLKKLSEECNLPYVTLHGMRHSYGTALRERGADIYTISKLLGHSSIEVTASIYVHNDVEVLRKNIGV